jgi:hypothetical protein
MARIWFMIASFPNICPFLPTQEQQEKLNIFPKPITLDVSLLVIPRPTPQAKILHTSTPEAFPLLGLLLNLCHTEMIADSFYSKLCPINTTINLSLRFSFEIILAFPPNLSSFQFNFLSEI